MKLVSCILLILLGISGIFSTNYLGNIYSQQSSNSTDPLADVSSNFSFMLEPNISNGSEISNQNGACFISGSSMIARPEDRTSRL